MPDEEETEQQEEQIENNDEPTNINENEERQPDEAIINGDDEEQVEEGENAPPAMDQEPEIAPNESGGETGELETSEAKEDEGAIAVDEMESAAITIPLPIPSLNAPTTARATPPAPAPIVVKKELTPEEKVAQAKREIEEEIQKLQLTKRYGLRDADPDTFKLTHCFGWQSHRRSNIHYVEEGVIVSSMGNLLIFINLRGGVEPRYVQGIREGSIGAIAVHPSKKFIAVGEMCDQDPNIYVYHYPSLELFKILRGGAIKGYADLSFNQAGTKIASVACDPDYMLTIWKWEESVILLRSKAFSQDVYRVSFSPDNDGILTTSGMGHIKFWRMSSTFTGLKLQGYIGKFGASELSDIASFMQLPDGKVLSSTETGNLLLWDGGMIKCEIGIKGKRPCHQGKIEVIILGEAEVITAGEDGYVRIWDLETIDNADVISTSGGSEGSTSVAVPRVFEMEPIDEILIAKDVKIKCIIRNPLNNLEYLIQDQQGQLIKLDLNKRVTDKMHSFHSGPVMGLSTSPSSHLMATIGADGNLRAYNYVSRELISKRAYPQGGSYLTFLPKCLDSLGTTVAAGFSDGLVRIICISANYYGLHYVFKPSKHAVKSIAFANDGSKMAIGSADGSVFLFNFTILKDSKGKVQPFTRKNVIAQPIGYIMLENSINDLNFAPEDETLTSGVGSAKAVVNNKRLLISTDDGSLITALIANDATFDTTTSYEIPTERLKVAIWRVSVPENLIVPAPLQPEDNTSPDDTDEAKAAARAKSKSLLLSQSMLSSSLNSLRKQKGLNITSNAKFQYAIPYIHGFFIAAIENQDEEAEIRLFKYSQPGFSLLLGVLRAKVTLIQYDSTKQFLMVGSKNGTCTFIRFAFNELPFDIRDSQACPTSHETYAAYVKRFEDRIEKTLEGLAPIIHNLDFENPPASVEVDGQQWHGHLHDIISGKITGLSSSYDNSHFISTGADGGIFVWRNVLMPVNTAVDLKAAEEQFDQFHEPEDITDANAYSIQEEKLKSERDREIAAAESKKQMIRNQIQELRGHFHSVVMEVESAAKSVKMDRTDLLVDPYLRTDIAADAQTKKELILKELAWDAEREAIGPEKLRKKFLEPLNHERIEIFAFKTNNSVATFRTLKLESTNEILAVTPAQIVSDKSNISGRDAILEEGKGATKEPVQSQQSEQAKKNQNSQKKIEAKKQFRAERAAVWKQLMEEKPDDKYQDPQDVAAIRYAIAHMGDYKLKSAENYIVPETERVDADKKKRQIILLNESIKTLKEQFNEKVFHLRTRKVDLIQEFTKSNQEIKTINGDLQKLKIVIESTQAYQPVLEAGIFPEKRSIVNEEDIINIQELEILQAAAQSRKGDDGMGFGSGSAAPSPVKESPPAIVKLQEKEAVAEVPVTKSSSSRPNSKPAEENVELRVKRVNLQYKKAKLSNHLSSNVTDFDLTVEHLANERILLSSDLKFADIKLQLLFREWMLLKEFEQTDNKLADKLNAKKQEKLDIEGKIDEYRDKLGAKKAEIEDVIKKEKDIHEEYRKVVGDNNKNEEYLCKVFKRKVKRSKKKIVETQDGEEEEEASEEEDDLSSYNSDDDENQEFEESCPSDCDPAVWTKVLEVRERRLDQEEILAEVQKAVELLKKENDSLIKKEKIIDLAMKNAESEIEDFQTQKQRKLNELDVIVPLRFSQIQYLVANKLPTDLSSSLVFYNEGLLQLKRRIKELHQEKSDIKKQHRELKKQHVSFNKSKKEKEQRVAELTEKNRDVQMLKFGQIVDLEKLEKLGVNKAADELKDKLQRGDNQRIREIGEIDARIKQEKEKYMTVVRENTEFLESLVDLSKQRKSLETALNLSQVVLTSELAGPNQKELKEKERLITLVQSQNMQIEAIKKEIEHLIKKPTSKIFPRPNQQQQAVYQGSGSPPPLPKLENRQTEEEIKRDSNVASLAAE